MRAKKQAVRLVNDYADLILRLSYTYLGSTADAEDVCQEVLLRLLGRAEAFEGPEHERAWVVRVTANRCKDLLRRRAARPPRFCRQSRCRSALLRTRRRHSRRTPGNSSPYGTWSRRPNVLRREGDRALCRTHGLRECGRLPTQGAAFLRR